MRTWLTLLLSLLRVVPLWGCGGCYETRELSAVTLSPATPCLQLTAPPRQTFCGAPVGHTFTGKNDCAVDVTWPSSSTASGQEVVLKAGEPFTIGLGPLPPGQHSLTLRLGGADLVATFTVSSGS